MTLWVEKSPYSPSLIGYVCLPGQSLVQINGSVHDRCPFLSALLSDKKSLPISYLNLKKTTEILIHCTGHVHVRTLL